MSYSYKLDLMIAVLKHVNMILPELISGFRMI